MGEGKAGTARTSHWLLLLVPPLLAWRSPVIGGAYFEAQYLIVPLAALLGRRFGIAGVMAVALGGLAFVVSVQGLPFGALGGSPGLYLVALCVAAMASVAPFQWPAWPVRDRIAARIALAAPLLLVISFAAGQSQSAGSAATRLAFFFSTSVLGYFAIFAMAARGVRLWPVLAGLVLVAAVTWPLTFAGVLPGRRADPSLAIAFLQPAQVLAAIAFYAAGATLRGALGHRATPWGFWRWPYLAAAVLLLLWFGPDPGIPIRRGGVYGVYIAQVAILLPVAAFTAGLLRGVRGTMFVTAFATALLAVGFLGRMLEIDLFRYRSLPLEAPFVALAFGRLGAALAAQGAPAAAGSPWVRALNYFALGLATTGAIVGEGGVARALLGAAFAVVFCLLYYAGVRARRATAGTPREITPEGWLTVTTVVCVAFILAAHAQEAWNEARAQVEGLWYFAGALWETLRDGDELETGTTAFVALVVALLVLGAIAAVRKSIRDARKVYRDLQAVADYVRRPRGA